ncbi:putative disease resistance protein At1g50180 [Macadamia integrifolia]|uniref:putative disease resistance protein At1g50180 n=1 Tax=Macadamia integrifolia TaxID=60698 RepID=UPI001C5005A2|nr:putative disease resistance protein At1g50180 [Macadamia integrifolia]
MALSIVSSVAQYLGGLVVHEKELLGGVADQIENIQVEMKQMQCFLKDADERVNESENIHNLVADIRDLAYNAEDIIESYILKAKYASFFNPKRYIRLHEIGKEIKTLQLKIQHFTRRVETYGFLSTGQEGGTSSTTEMQRQLRQSYPHYDDEDVIGIQDNIKVLVAELIKKEGPHLVSIVGMGGLGKTTLAKKVYNHDAVKRYFDCCAWSFISQQFQGRTILQEIIRKVCNEIEHENLNDGEMKEKLYKLLEDKCYLSWELFCKKDFLWKNVASSSSTLYHPEAEKKKKLGRDMIKKCGGLPLAVVVLRGLLGTKKSIHEWEMVAKDITKYLNRVEQRQEQHGVSGILSLSYHDLPSYIKPCFLYLGLYLEDSEIHKKVLIQMWIAEGFLQQYNGLETMSKEEIGEKYLLELINRSMVQPDEMSFHGKLKTCRLHDLMRDLCLQKAKEENFLSTFDGESAASDSSSSTSEMYPQC